MSVKINLPTLITISRFALIVAMLVCVLAYSPGRDYLRLACICFLILAIVSDMVDGRIARRLGQTTYLGAVLDSATDAFGFTLGFFFLYFIDTGMRFPLWISATVVARELLVYGMFMYVIWRTGRIDKRTHWLGKISTPLLALSILALFLRWEYAMPLWIVTVIVTVISGIENLYGSWQELYDQNRVERKAARAK